jgi:hypothetical protein
MDLNTATDHVWQIISIDVILKTVASLVFAALVAFIFAQIAQNRTQFRLFERQVFLGTDREETLLFVAACFLVDCVASADPVIVSIVQHDGRNAPFFSVRPSNLPSPYRMRLFV